VQFHRRSQTRRTQPIRRDAENFSIGTRVRPSQSECQNRPYSRATPAGFHNHWPVGGPTDASRIAGEAWVWISHGSAGWIRIHRMALARFTCENVEMASLGTSAPCPPQQGNDPRPRRSRVGARSRMNHWAGRRGTAFGRSLNTDDSLGHDECGPYHR
jgi:hypothetical protein